MDEKKHAKKLVSVYSDMLLNPIQLANLTVRMFNDQMTAAANEWYQHHYELYSYEIEDQLPFDLQIFDLNE
jgi:hypothetical protein